MVALSPLPTPAGPSPVPIRWRTEPVYRPVIAAFLALFRLLRLRFVVTGEQHLPASGGAVLAISHFGYLEFALLGAPLWWRRRRLVRYLATSAAFDHPLSGPFMRGMHHIPVDRRAGAAAYRAALERLAAGELVGVFPEGRVHPSWTLGEFKNGAARLAAAAGVPLIPVVVWGGHRVLTKGRRPSWRAARKVTVAIDYGSPRRPGSDATAETAALRAVMSEQLAAVQRRYPDHPRSAADRWWLPAHLGGSAPLPS